MTTQLEQNLQPCPICDRPGHRRIVELQPNNGELWQEVHEDGKICEWDRYDSVDSMYESRASVDSHIICPICGHEGKIITYRKDKIHKPYKYDYKISHDANACKMEEQDARDAVSNIWEDM